MGSSASNELDRILRHAMQLLAKGRAREALYVASGLVDRFCADPRAWDMVGSAQLALRRFDEALRSIDHAIDLAPHEPVYQLKKARCQIQLGLPAKAAETAERLASLDIRDPAVIDGLGAIFSYCEDPRRAQSFFERAVRLAPGNPQFRYNLATAQRMNGLLAEAEENCSETIRLNPHDYAAYYLRSGLRTFGPDDNHCAELKTLLQTGTAHAAGEVLLSFALAKELEDLHQFEESFEYLKRACDLRRAGQHYSVTEDVSVIDRIIATHTSEALFDGRHGFDSDEPIFVLGLPRTGSTLVERMLASHSQVYAAGELNNFAHQIVQAVGQRTKEGPLPRLCIVERSVELDFASLGKGYIDSTRPRTGHTPRFIDKMPQNFLYCGLIKAALPRARIIHVVRNPMDACYAIYKSMFVGTYPWSYDLHDIGHYYAAYHRLMAHWRRVLGQSILDVSYERLVTEPEIQARRLIDFCGLDWEATCLRFHELPLPSTTASATQIRQPLYRSSVGRWKRFEGQLEPLARLLTEQNIAY